VEIVKCKEVLTELLLVEQNNSLYKLPINTCYQGVTQNTDRKFYLVTMVTCLS